MIYMLIFLLGAMTKKFNFATTITILILISGCKGDTGPAGPSFSGSIYGTVTLINSDDSFPIDESGVTVSLKGTSLSTTSDSLGNWTINGLTTGTYTITATKPGYGMSELQAFQFVGGGNVPVGAASFNLAQPPKFLIVIDSVKTIADSCILVWYSINGTNGNSEYPFLVFIGNDSNVNGSNPSSYLDLIGSNSQTAGNGFVEFYASDLERCGFQSGMGAYLVASPYSDFNGSPYYSGYQDNITKRFAYTSLGAPSKVFRVAIP